MNDPAGSPPTAPPTVRGEIASLVALPTSRTAIASLVVGVIGLVLPLVGLGAIVLGIVAIRRIRRDRTLQGTGVAVAGICTGGAGILVSLVLAIMVLALVPAVGQARSKMRTQMASATMVMNAEMVHEMARRYAVRHGRYPSHVAALVLETPRLRPAATCTAAAAGIDPEPGSLVVAGDDLESFSGSSDEIDALRAAIEGLDTTAPTYRFGSFHFVRLPAPTHDGRIVFAWWADPASDGLVVLTDDGTAHAARAGDWQSFWLADADARAERGMEPFRPPPQP